MSYTSSRTSRSAPLALVAVSATDWGTARAGEVGARSHAPAIATSNAADATRKEFKDIVISSVSESDARRHRSQAIPSAENHADLPHRGAMNLGRVNATLVGAPDLAGAAGRVGREVDESYGDAVSGEAGSRVDGAVPPSSL